MDNLRPAIEQLRNHQRQLDMEGTFVGVSRQALDEVLDGIEADRRALVDSIVAMLRVETNPHDGDTLANLIAQHFGATK